MSYLFANPPGNAFKMDSGLGRAATVVTKQARNDIIFLIQRVTAQHKDKKFQGRVKE